MRILNNYFHLVRKICVFGLVGIFISIEACNNGNSTKNSEKLTFNKIEIVHCIKDTTQSYSLYLPSKYDSSKVWPVIFLFDPHGDGNFAVEKFKEAAERYGYILAGSNNSRNGIGNIDQIIHLLTNDIFNRFSIDQQRVYSAGFSGGARVALRCAMLLPLIKGVMMAGAGAKYQEITAIQKRIDIYATVGLGDFNYQEVVGMAHDLSGSKYRYIINEFEGIHYWPPENIINDVVLWFTLNAMRDKVLEKDKPFLEQLILEKEGEIKTLVDSAKLMVAELKLKNSILFFQGLISTRSFNRQLDKLHENIDYKSAYNENVKDSEIENTLKESFINSFYTQDSTWWKYQVAELNQRIAQQKGSFRKYMYMRVKSFLGIAAYTITNNYIASNQLVNAKKMISIYLVIEPLNADAWFFKAIFNDKSGNLQEAEKCLKKANELGFSDQKKFHDLASEKLKNLIKK